MFTTFPGPSPTGSSGMASGESTAGSVPPGVPLPPRPRQKRSQVTRACDWCRVHRIKCDNNHPCLNCQNRGGQCSNDRASEVRTLPHAFREIERLRQRNQELEKELRDERDRAKNQAAVEAVVQNSQLLTPPSVAFLSPPASAPPLGPAADGGGGVGVASKKYWEGIYTSTARSPAKTWYGPASLLYFLSRLNTFLTSTLHQHLPEGYMQPSSASRLLDGPNAPEDGLAGEPNRAQPGDPIMAKECLTPTQEEYFLEFYWQSYHTSLLILSEDEFKQHYKSLWVGDKENRKPSPLVDILLALCMQYGMARGRGNSHQAPWNADVDANDATLAGRWHYCRCQTLLASELESPTLSTVQCSILSVIWLCCASFQNMADSTLALTARTAQMLGLHLPPPEDMPRQEKEMRMRLWWSLFVLETKTSMKLGRPFLLQRSQVTCGLPGDGHEAATLSGSNFAPLGDSTTWLSWNLHNTKLVLAARTVYATFYDKYPDLFGDGDSQTIYEAPLAMEAYADFLTTQMKTVENWAKDVPESLKTRRKDHGVPFSTDLSALDIEQFAPFWVQRQRLLLELLYHNLCTNLYRPFICFRPEASSPESLPSAAESCAYKCVSHATAFTRIMRQVMSTTDILAGWHEAFQWQWNCAMTLVGFVLAYPRCDLAPAVRDAINASIEVLGIFGNSFGIAASAASLVRGLNVTADHVVSQAGDRTQLVDEAPKVEAGNDSSSSMAVMTEGDQTGMPAGPGSAMLPEFDEETIAAMQGILEGSMDMTFAVDGYSSANILWPSLDMLGK
ncbi:fungal-specific transcription factor domain-containing protein [Durotheca rogersii]|uniref:fungal-specific transcription factor domain-containing protein n=1 Tax=Durotheca rogersii TaxID=419775 RepID=UPI0022211A30|nr:fungal-specific transcription factor domain-containing protein [Durotheca rogersii]KAI5860472.1 fungal-specific transcription factor domain-containing protein [Durotheca rogersii]